MIRFDAGALRTTILNIRNLGVSERRAAMVAVSGAGRVLLGRVRQNISLRDHSLTDLARLDHPYARRHGGIRIHSGGTNALMHPEFRVHSQSGTMLNATRGRIRGGTTPSYRVEIDSGLAPHAVYVVSGTRVMLARDVLWDTAQAQVVRFQMMQAIVRALGPVLKSHAAVRFGGGPRPALPGGGLEA